MLGVHVDGLHSVVQAQELFSPQAENVIGTRDGWLGGIDVDGLFHGGKITRPYRPVVGVDREIKARIAKGPTG